MKARHVMHYCAFRDVDSTCSKLEETVKEACGLSADLVKVAAFGTYFNFGTFGTTCLWDIARRCNRKIQDAVSSCTRHQSNVNFLQVDYPNYPANGQGGVVEFVYELNQRKQK